MTPETLAYTAGLIDGEGNIGVQGIKPAGHHKRPNHYLVVRISMCDLPIIEWLHDTFGGFVTTRTNHPSRQNNNRRPQWAWAIYSSDAQIFLEQVLPYLQVKRRQAELAIEFQTFTSAHPMHWKKNRTAEIVNRKDEYRHQISQLNLNRGALVELHHDYLHPSF